MLSTPAFVRTSHTSSLWYYFILICAKPTMRSGERTRTPKYVLPLEMAGSPWA